MRASLAVAFSLLLGMVLLQAVTAVVKPGPCPPFAQRGIVDLFRCLFTNLTRCNMDQDCNGKQKCCRTLCGAVCENPIEKPGSCPPVMAKCTPGFHPPHCGDDYDCPRNNKCCYLGCTKACTTAELVVKPGKCPAGENIPCSPEMQECKGDEKCVGSMKCCNSRCGKRCHSPAVAKPGQCPPYMQGGIVARFRCMITNILSCNTDQDCKDNQKCCRTLCGTICTNPIEKPGSCPPVMAKCTSGFHPPQCGDDYDCPRDTKCCTPVCRRQCTKPILEVTEIIIELENK